MYAVEFTGPGTFELTSPRQMSGTYQVLNGYIALTYDGNDSPSANLPWSWKDNGKIDLDLSKGFGLD